MGSHKPATFNYKQHYQWSEMAAAALGFSGFNLLGASSVTVIYPNTQLTAKELQLSNAYLTEHTEGIMYFTQGLLGATIASVSGSVIFKNNLVIEGQTNHEHEDHWKYTASYEAKAAPKVDTNGAMVGLQLGEVGGNFGV